MKIIENGFYIIDDQFYIDFPDKYLKQNDEENRPHFYCFKEDSENIYWMIPLSRRYEKCENEIEKKKKEGKPCDYYHVLNIAGSKRAFLISDMFPVTENYFKREYTIANVHFVLLDKKQIRAINKKAQRIFYLINKGIKLHNKQPDVLHIYNQLKAKLIKEKSEEVAAVTEDKDNNKISELMQKLSISKINTRKPTDYHPT